MSAEERTHARETAMRYRERVADVQGRTAEPLPEPTENMLGELDLGEQYWGQTEIEMNVQLPTCEMMEKDKSKRLVHDCTWKNVNVHHWIKVIHQIFSIHSRLTSARSSCGYPASTMKILKVKRGGTLRSPLTRPLQFSIVVQLEII
jgi:hypothetical protein